MIVFVVLLLAMGLRSGLIIGGVLFITMCGTMIVMEQTGLILERISLGALIIALVMLVDNAIVITEGMLVAMQRGRDKLQAAKDVVSQTAIPLWVRQPSRCSPSGRSVFRTTARENTAVPSLSFS